MKYSVSLNKKDGEELSKRLTKEIEDIDNRKSLSGNSFLDEQEQELFNEFTVEKVLGLAKPKESHHYQEDKFQKQRTLSILH